MITPVIEYASPVWDPHTATNINLLEPVQRSAARLCFKDYDRFSSVSSMLIYFPWKPEESAKLEMMYTIINNLVSVPHVCLIPIPPFLRAGYFNQLDNRIDSFKFLFSHRQLNCGTQSPFI